MNRKIYFIFLILIISLILGYTIFSGNGLIKILKLKRDLNQIKLINNEIDFENQKLKAKVISLRRGKREIEKIARENFGLKRGDEIVFYFDDEDIK